jgi:hypothetical protein
MTSNYDVVVQALQLCQERVPAEDLKEAQSRNLQEAEEKTRDE